MLIHLGCIWSDNVRVIYADPVPQIMLGREYKNVTKDIDIFPGSLIREESEITVALLRFESADGKKHNLIIEYDTDNILQHIVHQVSS